MTWVAAIQMGSFPEIASSLDAACDLIAQAAKKSAKLAVLPENFATIGLTREEMLANAESFQQGVIQTRLSQCAAQCKIWLVGGAIPLKAEGHKVFSSCLVWNDQGHCVGRYNKIHLFDVTVGQAEIYAESEHVTPGDQIVVVPTPFGKIGLAICYDLRFPELFRALALKGAEIFVLPSAFTIPTGKAHWEVLLRARAIENLGYMIAPNEVGQRTNGLGTYGHSLIISPWGEILASLTTQTGVILAEIDLKKLQDLRQSFPVWDHYHSFIFKDVIQARGKA